MIWNFQEKVRDLWSVCRIHYNISLFNLLKMDFNTNLEQFIMLYHVIISNIKVCSFTCTISHMHVHAPKTVLHARKLVYNNYNLRRPASKVITTLSN